MTDFELYQGEDFAIVGEAVFDPSDTSQSLDDFKITIRLSTSVYDNGIMAYTEGDEGVKIIRKENNGFGINISHELTANLPEGTLYVTIELTHIETGTISKGQTQTITVSKVRL